MTEEHRNGDLEIAQDLVWQERMWKAERIGWVVAVMLLLANFVGLVGRGPLSQTLTGEQGDVIWVEYDRIAHLKAAATVRVHLGEEVLAADAVEIWLRQPYLNQMQISRITPEPSQVAVARDRYVYTFALQEPLESLTIAFDLTPVDFGLVDTEVGLEGQEGLPITQWIYP